MKQKLFEHVDGNQFRLVKEANNWYDVGNVVLTPVGYGATVTKIIDNDNIEVEFNGGIKKTYPFKELKPFTYKKHPSLSDKQAKSQFGNVPFSE